MLGALMKVAGTEWHWHAEILNCSTYTHTVFYWVCGYKSDCRAKPCLSKQTNNKKYTAPVRLELTTFRLTVGRCDQLSHGAHENNHICIVYKYGLPLWLAIFQSIKGAL